MSEARETEQSYPYVSFTIDRSNGQKWEMKAPVPYEAYKAGGELLERAARAAMSKQARLYELADWLIGQFEGLDRHFINGTTETIRQGVESGDTAEAVAYALMMLVVKTDPGLLEPLVIEQKSGSSELRLEEQPYLEAFRKTLSELTKTYIKAFDKAKPSEPFVESMGRYLATNLIQWGLDNWTKEANINISTDFIIEADPLRNHIDKILEDNNNASDLFAQFHTWLAEDIYRLSKKLIKEGVQKVIESDLTPHQLATQGSEFEGLAHMQVTTREEMMLSVDHYTCTIAEHLAGRGNIIEENKGQPVNALNYMDLPQEIKMPTDKAAKRLTEYLANRAQPQPVAGEERQNSETEGWQRLEPPESNRVFKTREFLVRARTPGNITQILDPETLKPALERILKERNERKAKTFIGSLAIGHTSGNPESFVIKVPDLLRLIYGYELGRTTNSANYWKAVTEIVKYLAVDLAWLEISVQVMVYGDKNPKCMQDYLMHRPRVITPQPLLLDNFVRTVLDLASKGKEAEFISYIKAINPEGFVLGFTRDALDALGADSYNPLEHISRELLILKGPAFWLGYNITFLRRWSNGTCPPGKGKLLLEALDESGYIEAATRGSRNTSYKDALKLYQDDLKKLIEIGILEDPGAIFHAFKRGRWGNISQQLQDWTQARGVRLTREKLSNIRIIYEFPTKRIEERAAATKKGKSIKAARQRAKAANEGRAQSAKKTE
jgi:hypothetical protein